jgi:hypothetical protein
MPSRSAVAVTGFLQDALGGGAMCVAELEGKARGACHRSRPLGHLGSAGLLWVINGGKLIELHRAWAAIERAGDRSRLKC